MTSIKSLRPSGSVKPRTVAIVPAAGSGKRLGMGTKKPFVLLSGKPIAARTLMALEKCKAIDEILVASEASCVKKFRALVKRYRLSKVSDIVVGGRTRFESVKNCLAAIKPPVDIVIVHDAARPFIDDATISESVKLARKFGACIVASRSTDTIKLVDDRLFIKGTLDRNKIFRAQTPQAFRYDIIKKAYAARDKNKITDDAGLVENIGRSVKVLLGRNCNMKITTREDIKLAEALL